MEKILQHKIISKKQFITKSHGLCVFCSKVISSKRRADATHCGDPCREGKYERNHPGTYDRNQSRSGVKKAFKASEQQSHNEVAKK